MSERLGVDLWMKRDDMTGIALSGNKIRKLEFLLAEAMAQGADAIITGGGEQSNHCRATALAAARLGMTSTLLLRTLDPTNPPATNGNILLDRMAGAEIVWIDHATWANREEAFAEHGKRLQSQGKKPYIIPEGGSNPTGSWGYVRCAEEIDEQLKTLPACESTTIVYACGSGGTGAGLVCGAQRLGWSSRGISVAGINVCNDEAYFVAAIQRIVRGMGMEIEGNDVRIVDGYVGAGYAKASDEQLALSIELARLEAIIVDPVYTGKAFYGLKCELERDPRAFGDRVVFVHTGGIFGLFPVAAQLAPLL